MPGTLVLRSSTTRFRLVDAVTGADTAVGPSGGNTRIWISEERNRLLVDTDLFDLTQPSPIAAEAATPENLSGYSSAVFDGQYTYASGFGSGSVTVRDDLFTGTEANPHNDGFGAHFARDDDRNEAWPLLGIFDNYLYFYGALSAVPKLYRVDTITGGLGAALLTAPARITQLRINTDHNKLVWRDSNGDSKYFKDTGSGFIETASYSSAFVSMSDSGGRIATAGTGGGATVNIYDAESLAHTWTFAANLYVVALSLSPDGDHLAALLYNGDTAAYSVRIIDPTDGTAVHTFTGNLWPQEPRGYSNGYATSPWVDVTLPPTPAFWTNFRNSYEVINT